MSWRELITLLPIKTAGAPALPIEESTFGRVDEQLVRFVALRRDIRVVGFVAEL
jgi:hypothetical protein